MQYKQVSCDENRKPWWRLADNSLIITYEYFLSFGTALVHFLIKLRILLSHVRGKQSKNASLTSFNFMLYNEGKKVIILNGDFAALGFEPTTFQLSHSSS